MATIVARDPVTDDLGIALEVKTLAGGAVIPWAKAGVGAIATAGVENPYYGRHGLELLAAGRSLEETITMLTGADPRASWRQLAIVDANGRSYVYTGADMVATFYSLGVFGPNVATMGASPYGDGTLKQMVETYLRTPGRIWTRLMAALHIGQHMVSDTRTPSQHSAALLVVRQRGGYGEYTDRLIDLRVDDDHHPVEALEHLLRVHEEQFLPCDDDQLIEIDSELTQMIQKQLAETGYYHGWIAGDFDEGTAVALEKFAERENMELLLRADGCIDRRLVERLGIADRWRVLAVRGRDAIRGH